MLHLALLTAICLVLTGTGLLADIPLKLEALNGPNESVTVSANGTLEISGTVSLKATPATPIKPGKWVLEMEVFSVHLNLPLHDTSYFLLQTRLS